MFPITRGYKFSKSKADISSDVNRLIAVVNTVMFSFLSSIYKNICIYMDFLSEFKLIRITYYNYMLLHKKKLL